MSDGLVEASLGAMIQTLQRRGLDVLVADGFGRPDLMVMDPERGIIAIDVSTDSGESAECMKGLNRKITHVTAEVPELDNFQIYSYVLAPALSSTSGRSFLPAEATKNLSWLDAIPHTKLDSNALRDAVSRLGSAVTFTMGARPKVSDPGANDRAARRVTLDAQQSGAAIRRVEDVLVISGPAGSGKSLVLAARARWLANMHPQWHIQMLCYNKALVPYLRSLVDDHSNIHVDTFGRFAYGLGHRFSFEDDEQANLDLRRAMRSGIPIAVDALLIDESQDFFDSWLRFAAECLFPNRGGIVLAGDAHQALYRDSSVKRALAGHTIEEVHLKVPYRSTRQILEVVAALDPDQEIEGNESAPEGEPVEVVWAESVVEQARALSTDLRILHGQGRPWSDMGMLVTQKFMIGPVAGALKQDGVPFEVIKSANALDLDLSHNSVKVLTVHSSKGLEFGVVCLVGLEQLKDPADRGLDVDERTGRERTSRLCLVGPTRARDLLFISYTKDSVFLERLRSSDAPFRAWTWPDDYAVEA